MKLIALSALSVMFIVSHAVAQMHITGPAAVIYKTRKDYRHHVPVILSDDKTRIVSFPAPSDLRRGGTYTMPTPLHKGYLLDNRGINQNVAFLKWTYEAYSALKQPPPMDKLYRSIADKNPLTALYNCGLKRDPQNDIKHLNELIDKKQLPSDCRRMK